MRVGFVVDGQAELYSLPKLLPKIPTPHTLLQPVYADIQPWSPTSQIVRAVKSRLNILAGRRADLAVILLDLESRRDCPGVFANALKQALTEECIGCGVPHFAAVIKHRMYENWLVSDPDAFAQMPKRFQFSEAHRRRVVPDRADHVNGTTLLKASRRGSYDKVEDAVAILEHADPLRMAANSRSFRRLLRVVGNPIYQAQSLRP